MARHTERHTHKDHDDELPSRQVARPKAEPEQLELETSPRSASRPGYPDIHGTFGTSLADRGD